MIKFYKIFWALLAMLGFSACVEIDPESRSEQQPAPNMQYAEPQMQQPQYVEPQYVEPQAVEYVDEYAYPPCLQETTVVVYDDAGAYQVPGCVMTAEAPMVENAPLVENAPMVENASGENEDENDEDEEIDPDDIEGEFPHVVNNKYMPRQVVMQNLQTRVLAYCRGTDDEMNECISRLECAGYTQLRNVPTMPAKYDILKKGTYPTRRWRNGETVPRW